MENVFPTTSKRVPLHTNPKINARIQNDTLKRLEKIGHKRDQINIRLDEIEKEWDIERALEANASAVIFLGLGLGLFSSKKWLLLSGIATGFLLQHATQGWCPPLPVLRRLGFRTQREIDNERMVLLSRLE